MNMNIGLYQYLPKQCRVNKEIPKAVFLKNGRVKSNANNKFDLYFVDATLSYVMRGSQGDLPNLQKDDQYGDEIHVMEVNVKTRSDGWYPLNNFARAILEAYPRPLLLILVYHDEYCLFTTLSHINSRNRSKNVADKLQGSGWFTQKNQTMFDYPWDFLMSCGGEITVSPVRRTEKELCSIMLNNSSIETILKKWFEIIGDDRGRWVYFYRCSDDYARIKRHERGIFDDEYEGIFNTDEAADLALESSAIRINPDEYHRGYYYDDWIVM